MKTIATWLDAIQLMVEFGCNVDRFKCKVALGRTETWCLRGSGPPTKISPSLCSLPLPHMMTLTPLLTSAPPSPINITTKTRHHT